MLFALFSFSNSLMRCSSSLTRFRSAANSAFVWIENDWKCIWQNHLVIKSGVFFISNFFINLLLTTFHFKNYKLLTTLVFLTWVNSFELRTTTSAAKISQHKHLKYLSNLHTRNRIFAFKNIHGACVCLSSDKVHTLLRVRKLSHVSPMFSFLRIHNEISKKITHGTHN